jgi:hypothetical protein
VGETVYIDEFGIFPGIYHGPWQLPVADDLSVSIAVLRDDGQYVIGASPLNPIECPDGASQITVNDFTAPYGLSIIYTAVTTVATVGSSAPSLPSLPVTMGQAPDTMELYSRIGWAADQDASGLLLKFLAGIGNMLQAIDSISRDSYDTDYEIAPSWSTVLDINRCPTEALPWLGQFVGARFPTNLRDDQQRYMIEHVPGWSRGTPAAILAAASLFLLPGFVPTLTERDTSPYHLTISIPSGAVVSDATYGSLWRSYATYSDLEAAFATYADIWAGDDAIESAILDAIPAGLVCAVDFV